MIQLEFANIPTGRKIDRANGTGTSAEHRAFAQSLKLCWPDRVSTTGKFRTEKTCYGRGSARYLSIAADTLC